MPDGDSRNLTDTQIKFLEKYCSINIFFERKKSQDKRASQAQDFRVFNLAAQGTQKALDKLSDRKAAKELEVDLAQATTIMEGKDGKANLPGALNKLDEINSAMEIYELRDECRQGFEQVTRRATEVLKQKTGNDIQIRAFLENTTELNEAAFASDTMEDTKAAVAAIKRLNKLLDKAVPGSEFAGTEGGAAAGQRKLALGAHGVEQDRFNAVETRCGVAFVAAWPPTLTALRETARDALVVADTDDADAITGKTKDAAGKITTFVTSAETFLKDHGTWTAARKAALSSITDIKAHKMAADVTYVAPEIVKVDLKLTTGDSKATAFDYPGATSEVAGIPANVKDIFSLADNVAKLAAVRTVRETLVGTLPTVPSTFKQVKDLVDAANLLLTEGKDAADNGRLAEAVTKFDAIPAAVDKALVMVRHAGEYTKNHQAYLQRRNVLANKAGDVGDALAGDLAICTTQLNAAATASRTDLDLAIQKLGNLWRFLTALEARVVDVEKWLTDKQDFDTRLEAVKNRDGDEGRVAIEDYYQRLLADKSRAEALVAPGAAIKEWMQAIKLVTASKPLQVDKIKLADVAKDYLARKKDVEKKIEEVEKKAEATVAAQPIAGLRTLIATAVAQTVAKDWKGAVETLKTAATEVQTVEKTIAAAEKITEARNDPALGNIGSNFGAANAAYLKAKTAADTADGSENTFLTIRQEAAAKAQQAQVAATGSTPNPAQAGTLLGEAITVCENVVRKSGERAAFNITNNLVRNDLVTKLPAINTDNIITTDISNAINDYNNAATPTRAPLFDYSAAVSNMAQLHGKIEKMRRKATAHKDTAADRTTITDATSYIDAPAVKPLLDPEIQKLKDLKTEIEDFIKDGEREKAVAKAKDGAKLAKAYRKLAEDYLASIDWITEGMTTARSNLLAKGTLAEIDTYAKADLAAIDAAKISADDLTQKRAFNAILGLAQVGYQAGKAGERKVTDGKAWEIVRAASETELKKLTDRRPIRNPFIAEKVDALEARYTAAGEQVKIENYAGATKRLSTFVADCLALAPDMIKFDTYRTARDDAGKAMAELSKVKDTEAIAPLVAQLRAQHDAAVAMADQGRFDEATTAFAAIRQGVVDAAKAAKEHEDFANLTEQAKAVPQGDSVAMKAQIEKGREFIKALRKEKEYTIAMDEIVGASGELDQAVTLADTNTDAAAEHLAEAMRVCTLARLAISLFAQLLAAEAKSQKEIADFLAKPEATFVRDALIALQKRLDAGVTRVRIEPTPANRNAADGELAAVMAEFATLTHVAQQQVVYTALKDEVERALADMDRHDQRFAMKDDIAEVRQVVATTSTQAEKHDHTNAIERLKKAQERLEAALIKAEMVGDKEPTPAALKKILAREGGSDTIDAIVASLDDTAKKKVLRVAFEARFGCKLEVNKPVVDQVALDNWYNSTVPTPTDDEWAKKRKTLTTYPETLDGEDRDADVQKFYKVMTDLPDSDTLDNDSMIEFEATKGPAEGSFYGGGKKRVTMREGKFGDSGVYAVGLKHELEETDPDSIPEPAPGISYFSWNTLHEVGHAVDDKKGFMKQRGAALAGWKEYFANTYPIAEALAGKFDFDAAYISEYLAGVADPPIPAPKGGVDVEEWERRRVLSCAWCDRARVGKEPWQSAALAKEVAIDGVCYQESYANTWTSYPLAARKKGVSGYQFRAPGEWFSELYAAFHTGKLNKGHPARAWLETL